MARCAKLFFFSGLTLIHQHYHRSLTVDINNRVLNIRSFGPLRSTRYITRYRSNMKTFAIILALAATIVSATPAADEGTTLVTRDANCDFCLERYNFCLKVSDRACYSSLCGFH